MSKPAELIQIRCNSCWAIADKNNTLFFITNCYHVFCASCLKNNKNYCKVCLKSCATLPINPDLPDEVKMFFKAKSCDKLLDNLHRITTFQENQTKMFHETLTTYDMKNYFKKKTMIKKSIAIKKKYNDLFRQENDLSAKLKAAKRSSKIHLELLNMNEDSTRKNRVGVPGGIVKKKISPGGANLLQVTLNNQFLKSQKLKLSSSRSPSMEYSPSYNNQTTFRV